MDRRLDGYFFRVKRGDTYVNVCFSDMTSDEQDEVLKDKPVDWLKSLAKGLGSTLKQIGDTLDISRGEDE